jgi:hypothetical protein
MSDMGGVTINPMSRRSIVIDQLEFSNSSIWDDVVLALDVSGSANYALARGDIVETRGAINCTVNSSTDQITSAGHGFPDGIPIYLKATTLPSNYTSGTLLYVRDSDYSGTNTAFKVSTSLGGAVFDFGSAGTNVQIVPAVLCIRNPTTTNVNDKFTVVNGIGMGMGVAVPLRWYWVARGPRCEIRINDAHIAGVGDHVVPVIGSRKGDIDNLAATILGIVTSTKSTALAGAVQAKRK